MRTDNTVLIVGAGICGLTTALALAGQGRRVHLFESRAHPGTPRSQARISRSLGLARLANRALCAADPARSERLFDAAAKSRAGLWGQRNRNLLFDHHSLEFMRGLGADCTRLPTLTGFDTHLGPGQPSVCIRYGPRSTTGGSGRLDAATIIAQRDPVSAPTIGDVETMLLDAAAAHPLIRLSFDTPVASCSENEDGVELHCDDDTKSVFRGALLVLADGGGRRSASHRLGIPRVEAGREEMNIAAFQCDAGEQLLGHPLDAAWLVARTTATGWVVFLCSGAGRLTVNTRRVVGANAPTALALARDAGVTGALLEAPADFQYPLDRASRFVAGERILLVGDAACRASPIWAFGAQFALLWAQMISDLCAGCPEAHCSPAPAAIQAFCQEAERISRMRLEFESSVIELVDFTNAGVREVSEIAMSQNLFAALDEVELRFRAGAATGGGLDMRLGINLAALIAASDKPDLSAFCAAVGRFDIDGAMALRFDGNGAGTARADAARPMHYRTDLEDIQMPAGDVSIRRDPAGYWSLLTSGVHLHRLVRHSHSDTLAGIERAEVRLPDDFVTNLLKQMGPRLWALGAIRQRPLQFDLALAPGRLRLGAFHLRLRGRPRVRATLARRAGGSRFCFELRGGTASVANFSAFLRASGLRATRFLRSGQRLLGGLADPFIDLWASGASHLVRKVEFEIHTAGNGTAIYHFFGLAVPIALSKRDVEQLIDELFDSRSCEQIMRHYQRSLIAADVGSPRSTALAPGATS